MMNDFTKEELRHLADAILYCPLESRREKLLLIREKIKSMIDNYCEHDYRTSNESHFKCKDCGIRER